jgi:hypothetical protein
MIAANSGKLSHFIITQKKFAKVEDLKGATVGILTMTEGSFFNWQEIAQKHGLKFPEDYKVLETAGAGARHTCWSRARSTSACSRSRGPMSPRTPASTISAPRRTMCRSGSSRSTTSTATGRKPIRARSRVSSARSCGRPTGSIGNRAEAAEIAARELNIKPAYAERAWDYYTKTGTLTRDLSFTEAGFARCSRRRSRPGCAGEHAVRHEEIRRRQLPQAGARHRQIRQVIRAIRHQPTEAIAADANTLICGGV